MKNELTSTFEQLLYQIWNLNKNNLIRVYNVLDNSFSYEFLLTKKNHELKYKIILKVIDNIDLMKKVIKESIRIKQEKEFWDLVDFLED